MSIGGSAGASCTVGMLACLYGPCFAERPVAGASPGAGAVLGGGGLCGIVGDGTPCDDGNACTVGDSCQGGACVGGTSGGVIPPGGGTVSGTTSGHSADFTSSCGPDTGAPELVFRWTPATSGTARIQTCGATFDAHVYVRASNCSTELACGHACDAGGSRLALPVSAATTYFIFVDGFFLHEGSFTLTVALASPLCGNGLPDPGEQCDDGNHTPCDGCAEDCRREACGNGIIDCLETCDDGNVVSGDGCDADCQPTPGFTTTTTLPCGNGVKEPDEECDLGSRNGASAESCCRSDCHLRATGFLCRRAVSACDIDEVCDGENALCPTDSFAPPRTFCVDGDPCTVEDTCQGIQCGAGTRVCGATVAASTRNRNRPPVIIVTCTGTPVAGKKATCTAEGLAASESVVGRAHALTRTELAVRGRCRGGDNVTKRLKKSLGAGAATIPLKLNACGKKLYRMLAPAGGFHIDVPVTLEGVTLDENRSSATLPRAICLARGGRCPR